jgi:hypothetical protein
MMDAKVTYIDERNRVTDAVDRAAFKNFGHAAARIRKDAIESIVVSPVASTPGTPPHTRRKQLTNAIVFDANKDGAVIGPRFSRVGDAGAAHEFGGEFRGQLYPERQFMLPALESNLDRFADEWRGSVGEA